MEATPSINESAYSLVRWFFAGLVIAREARQAYALFNPRKAGDYSGADKGIRGNDGRIQSPFRDFASRNVCGPDWQYYISNEREVIEAIERAYRQAGSTASRYYFRDGGAFERGDVVAINDSGHVVEESPGVFKTIRTTPIPARITAKSFQGQSPEQVAISLQESLIQSATI